MEEIRKPIKDYEGLYEVSNMGNIKSLNYNGSSLIGLMTPCDSRGYLQVCLSKGGKHINKSVHRLVALVFISNKDNKVQVNHKNGITTDNRVENLEWCTCSENNIHAFKVLGRKHPFLGKTGGKHFGSKEVLQLTLKGNSINNFLGAREAGRKTGISSSSIIGCCLGKRHTAGGFIWKYKNEETI